MTANMEEIDLDSAVLQKDEIDPIITEIVNGVMDNATWDEKKVPIW